MRKISQISNILLGLIGFLLLILLLPQSTIAQEQVPPQERLEAKIVEIEEEKEIDIFGQNQLYQKLKLEVLDGSVKGQTVTVENGNIPSANVIRFQIGDEVVITATKDLEGNDLIYITDYVRRMPLVWLAAIFVILTLIVGRWRGLNSILSLAISFLIIYFFILPKIISGSEPVIITILGSVFIVPVTFYLSHGLNKKTSVAIFSTAISLLITGILAKVFVEVSHLSGFVSEEAGFLQVATQGLVNIKGLLLSGIIIGTLGVLDDVTVSQAAIVEQLKGANAKLEPGEVYARAMKVGQDHIASMVNTLVLVYAGAALPLMLLFLNSPEPFGAVVNHEIIAEEVVRTLVGSIGLVLAVPIATVMAIFMYEKGR